MKNVANEAKLRLQQRRKALLRLYDANKKEEDELAKTNESDWPDRAVLQSGTEILHGLAEHERHELQEIAAALQKIERGEYGRCETCDRAIGHQRLNAIPETPLCIACSEKRATA